MYVYMADMARVNNRWVQAAGFWGLLPIRCDFFFVSFQSGIRSFFLAFLEKEIVIFE